MQREIKAGFKISLELKKKMEYYLYRTQQWEKNIMVISVTIIVSGHQNCEIMEVNLAKFCKSKRMIKLEILVSLSKSYKRR